MHGAVNTLNIELAHHLTNVVLAGIKELFGSEDLEDQKTLESCEAFLPTTWDGNDVRLIALAPFCPLVEVFTDTLAKSTISIIFIELK